MNILQISSSLGFVPSNRIHNLSHHRLGWIAQQWRLQ